MNALGGPVGSPVIVSQREEIRHLEALLPIWKEGTQNLQELAAHFSQVGLKDLFLYLGQQQARCSDELEKKIKELGGEAHDSKPIEAARTGPDAEDERQDPMMLDKAMLLRFINGQTYLLHLYREVRRHSFPFDIRMVLQRHQLHLQEVFDRVSMIYLAHPTRQLQVA
jgi:hypothetical protein